MSLSIRQELENLTVQDCDLMTIVNVLDTVDEARNCLQRFIDERELSPDAVEEIEEVIKCLE